MDPLKELPPPPRKGWNWLSFLAGLIVGALAITSLAAVALRRAEMREATVVVTPSAGEADETPAPEEVREYLDRKTIPADRVEGGRPADQPIVLRAPDIDELKWTAAGRPGGPEEPWSHHYSLLFHDGTEHYVADVNVKVRAIGRRRVFVGFEIRKVVRAEQIR